MSVKFNCGQCGAENQLPLPRTFQQQVEDFVAAINTAAPSEMRAAATAMQERAESPASRISMRRAYLNLAKLLKEEGRR
jgi:hypothetical protein